MALSGELALVGSMDLSQGRPRGGGDNDDVVCTYVEHVYMHVCVHTYICVCMCVCVCVCVYIQGVPGGIDKTSGECSLG